MHTTRAAIAASVALFATACTFSLKQRARPNVPGAGNSQATPVAEAAEIDAASADVTDDAALQSFEPFDLTQAVYSCRQTNESGKVEVCVEVSTRMLGNDENAILSARQHCGNYEWRIAEGCPPSGAKAQCLGASLEGVFVYDKFVYAEGISITEECHANGGKS